MIRISNIARAAGMAAFAASLLGIASTSSAQAAAGGRWEAWIGCWSPAASPGTDAPAFCVTPLTDAAVQVATIQNGAVVARDTLDASGASRAVDKQGCAGTQTGRWSADNRRVFIHSDATCAGGVKRIGNSIVTITPTGEWLEVQSVSAGGSVSARAIHYRDVSASRGGIPADIAAAISSRALSISAARTVAGGTLEIPAIAEAVRLSDTTAVATWIVERGTRFELSGRQLAALADAGVPGAVTDVMIGVSYPEHFALQRRDASVASIDGIDSLRIVNGYLRDRCGYGTSIYIGMSLFDPCGFSYGYGYGFGNYYNNYYYGSRYGNYSPYGYTNYYGGGPIVIVKGEEQPHGQVVKGRGYTRGESGSSGSSGSTTRSSGSSGGSSAGSSAGSSSSGSSGDGGSSSGRTAHPRPPV